MEIYVDNVKVEMKQKSFKSLGNAISAINKKLTGGWRAYDQKTKDDLEDLRGDSSGYLLYADGYTEIDHCIYPITSCVFRYKKIINI